jgi:sarcosine oxidase subunit beta
VELGFYDDSITVSGANAEADFVVNAAGPWSGKIASMAGVDYPIKHTRRQMLTIEPETPIPESNPLTNHLDRRISFRPEREGVAISSGGFDAHPTSDIDPDSYSKKLDFDYAAKALEVLNKVAGYFGEGTRIRDGWAGLYTNTPDHNPIIEETVPGMVTATGFSGHGFMHSPATGKVVSELVTEGEASLIDISSLTRDRFDGAEETSKDLII